MSKTFLKALSVVVALAAAVGCAKDEDDGLVLPKNSSVVLPSVVNQSQELTFTANGSWRAKCDADWLTFSPQSGDEGEQTVTISTMSTNRTKLTRTATLTITSGSAKRTVTVKQRNEYAVFDEEQYVFAAGGDIFEPAFKTNVSQEDLALATSIGLEDWIAPSGNWARTRAEMTGSVVPLVVQPNTSRSAREGALFLMMYGSDDQYLPLDTLWLFQQGANTEYSSSDFSADGQVWQLNVATKGKGITFVLMGDGFVDRDVADSTYSRIMERALETLFSEEPIRSLRDYFNVYAVTAVSKDENFGEGYSTALGCIPDYQTTGIEVERGRVESYMRKVEGIDMENALAVVVMNSDLHKGVTYMFDDDHGKPANFSIALCTLQGAVEDEEFRTVLVHEAIGHGFAKFADEYVDAASASATDDDLRNLSLLHRYNWCLNVDGEGDATKVIWSSMIGDEAFNGEDIGVYEGGYTYYKGVFRPTEESMMRHNDSPFNGPSRRAIYNKVMEMGEGTTPTYDEFVIFDRSHKPDQWHYSNATRSPWTDYLRLRKNSCIIWRHSSSSTPLMH